MKRFLLSVTLCLFSTLFHAQKDKTIYLDSIGKETEYINHMTYLVIKDFDKEKKQYNISEYYKSGKLKSEGICSNKWSRTEEGIFNRYYENGKIHSRTMYDKGLPYGDYNSWHENGNKNTEGEYLIFEDKDGKKTSELLIKNYWDENGTQKVFNGNGSYTDVSDLENSKGEILDGLKNGLWEGHTKVGDLTFKEYYKKGKLTEGTSIDSSNNTYKYTKTQAQAEPANGLQNFYRIFATNVNIPEPRRPDRDSDDRGVPEIKEVKIMLGFVVEKNGTITEIKTLRSNNTGAERSAKKVLSKMAKWIPAVHRGKTVRAQFTLPITITIN